MAKYTFWYKCYYAGIKSPEHYIEQLYIGGMSSIEITEHFANKYEIITSSRNIQHYIKRLGITRTCKEHKVNAIKRGRMIYYKKPEREKYKHGSISAKQRLAVLTKDKFKCTLCGNSPKTGFTLEIHHKNGTSSDLENLQTLCYLCHKGLHANKEKV